MLRFGEGTYLSVLFKFILSARLSNRLLGSKVLLFLLNSLHCYILFLVTSFSWYKGDILCLISFNKFSDVLPDFTCASAIGNI